MIIKHDHPDHSIARISGGVDYLLRLTLADRSPGPPAITTLRRAADSDAHFQANEAIAAAVQAAVAEGLAAIAAATGHQFPIKTIAYHQTGRDPAAAVTTFHEMTIVLLQEVFNRRNP